MIFSHFKGSFAFPGDFIEGQSFSDPFSERERSKTLSHKERTVKSEKAQNLLKNKENES